MKYKVIKENGDAAFDKAMIQAIKDGWVPQGGIFMEHNTNRSIYVQAMIKKS